MKYFIDTEFIEGFHKSFFSKRRHHVDLISIGIVAEDGRTYFSLSKEYNYSEANDWVKKNVILPLYIDFVSGDARNSLGVENFHKVYGKSNKEIAKELEWFIKKPMYNTDYAPGHDSSTTLWEKYIAYEGKPEFYGYYSDYDWVVFCSLFGTMMDLPKGFPMYCKDLKQTLDEKANSFSSMELSKMKYPKYRKQTNEHNALYGAGWNYNLYQFLNSL